MHNWLVIFLVAILAGYTEARAAFQVQKGVHDPNFSAPYYHPTLSDSDDAYSEVISLTRPDGSPFKFPFYDTVFTQMRIHTNGFITLGTAAPSDTCGPCWQHKLLSANGQPEAPNYLIAPWWADWNPSLSGSIYYGLTGPDQYDVLWYFVRPYGSTAGQEYSFRVRLFTDGRIEFHYWVVNGGYYAFDYGRKSSIGTQPRSASGYAHNIAYSDGGGSPPLSSFTAYKLTPYQGPLPITNYDKDPNVPDLVERWAPDIWHDYYAGEGRCDASITNVDYDGDWRGSNNSWLKPEHSTPGVVYYSLVQSHSHYFIGYYFYHPKDCSAWYEDGHDNDWEGVVVAVNSSNLEAEAVLTNVHGRYIPYRSPYPTENKAIPHYLQNEYADPTREFTLVTKWNSSNNITYDTIGVGVEARTHAVWGRWNNKCVIGPTGTPSGCDDSHGGDGFIYTYTGSSQQPTTFHQYPHWVRYGYKLVDIASLFTRAHWGPCAGTPTTNCSCGQDEWAATYACESPPPWKHMNGGGEDAGSLPWAWGMTSETPADQSICHHVNMLLDPASIFKKWFVWTGNYDWAGNLQKNTYVNTYHNNKYLFALSQCAWGN